MLHPYYYKTVADQKVKDLQKAARRENAARWAKVNGQIHLPRLDGLRPRFVSFKGLVPSFRP